MVKRALKVSHHKNPSLAIIGLAFLTVALAAITISITSGKINFNPNEGAAYTATPHPICSYPNACYGSCPTNYISKTGSCNQGICCGPRISPAPTSTPKPSASNCVDGRKKCVAEGSVSYVYVCNAGSWQKNRRCDFGCNVDSSCKVGCIPGGKMCSNGNVKTCSSDGTVWYTKVCKNGCLYPLGIATCI